MKIQKIVNRRLKEGVPFKGIQKRKALDKSKVRVGIEYEFYADKGMSILNFTDVKKHIDANLPHITYSKIEPEHDSQVELVTDAMPVKDALRHMDAMFKEFTSPTNGVQFGSSDLSGLHLSISYTDYATKHLNGLKFALLMDAAYIHRLFPERKHVESMEKVVIQSINSVLEKENDFTKMVPLIEDTFRKLHVDGGHESKYFTIKLSDHAKFNGRVELRFFGGDGYENMVSEIKDQLARSIYLLDIAYGNAYHQEYLTQLYKKVEKVKNDIEKREVGTSVFSKARHALKNNKVDTSIRKAVVQEFEKYFEDPSKMGDLSNIEIYRKVYPQSFERNYERIVKELIAPKASNLNAFLGGPLEDRIAVDVLKYVDLSKKKSIITDYINNAQLLSFGDDDSDESQIKDYLSKKEVQDALSEITEVQEFDPRKHIKIVPAYNESDYSKISHDFDQGFTFAYYINGIMNKYNVDVRNDEISNMVDNVIDDASGYVMNLFRGILSDDSKELLAPESNIVNIMKAAGKNDEFKELISKIVGREYHELNSRENMNSLNREENPSIAANKMEQQVTNLLSILKALQ